MLSCKNALILFVKYPEPGQVKTRLGHKIGFEQAARLYQAFVEDILQKVQRQDFQVIIAYNQPKRVKEIRDWLGSDRKYILQRGDDLGAKMYNAFSDVFETHYDKIILMGTDIPLVKAEDLVQGFTHLNDKTVVLGPSLDGGFYLMGLTPYSLDRGLFEDIEWSTSAVWAKTTQNIQAKSLGVHTLKDLRDIDQLEDLQELKTSHGLRDLQRTLEVLNQLDI